MLFFISLYPNIEQSNIIVVVGMFLQVDNKYLFKLGKDNFITIVLFNILYNRELLIYKVLL
jgi:hypothetical protein